jgi:hypothetical protein
MDTGHFRKSLLFKRSVSDSTTSRCMVKVAAAACAAASRSVTIVIVVVYHSADACGITSTARFSSSMVGQKVVRQ